MSGEGGNQARGSHGKLWVTGSICAAFVIMATTFVSCRTEVPAKDDLYGTYFVEFPFGQETLVLNRDGTYDQEIVIHQDSDTVRYSNSWRYDDQDGKVVLERGLSLLADFCELNPYYSEPVEGTSIITVNTFTPLIKPLELMTACECVYYVKVK